MFSFEVFFEIQVVGVLFLLALSPLLILGSPTLRRAKSVCPPLDLVKDKTVQAGLLVVFAFVTGIVANRLVDDLFDDGLEVEGQEWYKKSYAAYADTVQAPAGKGRDEKTEGVVTRTKSLKVAEFLVSDSSETAQRYFERHKSFMRVLRGGAVAALLFLLLMLVHDAARLGASWDGHDRYSLPLYLTVGAAAALLFLAYRHESTHYYDRICELATYGKGCKVDGDDPGVWLDARGTSDRPLAVMVGVLVFAALAALVRAGFDLSLRGAARPAASDDRGPRMMADAD